MRARRAATLTLGPEAAKALQHFAEAGGHLAIVGPPRSGRTSLMDAFAARLAHAPGHWLRMAAVGGPAWSAIEEALADPGLPGPPRALPNRADPQRRAQVAARELRARCPGRLSVLVDPLEALDAPSRSALAALAKLPNTSIVVAAERSPRWCDQATVLPSWSGDALASLASSLLGRSLSPPLLALLSKGSDGRPGQLVDRLEGLVAAGQLDLQRASLIDESKDKEDSPLSPVFIPPEAGLQAELAGLVALSRRAWTPSALARFSGVDETEVEQALHDLHLARLLRLERGWVRCWDPVSAAALMPADATAAALSRRLVLAWATGQTPRAWLVCPLVDAGDPELVRRLGAAALIDLDERDPKAAQQAAAQLWAIGPETALGAVCVRALAKGGRPGEALTLGEHAVEGCEADAQLEASVRATLHAELARLHLDQLGDRPAARAALREGRRALAGGVPPLVLLDVETALHQLDEHASQALATARQGTNRPIPAPSWERSAWLRLRVFEAQALASGGRIDAATARLADLPEDASADERELFWVETGALLWRAGQFIPAGDAYARAARFDPSTHSADQVRWMDRAATARYHGGDRSGAVVAWTQAMALAREAELVVEIARIGATLASVLLEVCRFEDAARVGQEAYDCAVAAGVAHHAINAALAMGDLRLVSGATDEAATWFGRCAALVERHKLVRARARLARRWAELAVRIRDPRAMQTVSDALTAANQAELNRDACRVMALKAVLLGRLGRVEQLRPTLDRACAPLIQAGAARTLAEVRLWAAEALLEAGLPDQAIEEAARAVVWADEVGHTLYRTRADDLTARARAQAHRDAPAGEPGDLERLLEIAVALGGERELPRLLDRIVDAALHLVHADRAFVVLLDEAQQPKVVAARSIDGSRPGRPSSSVVHTTLKRGREVIVSDVAERGDLRAQDSIVHMRLRSALCVPMLESDRAIGAIYVDSRVASQGELTRSTRLLRALAGLAGVAVTNARLLTESLSRAERAAEMAHDIRSPLSSVAMAAEQLVELGGMPEWAHEMLGLMEAQAHRVMGLAERVLEDRPGQPRTIDLAARAERLVGLASRDARIGGRAVHFEALGDAHILADPDELDRAITNLLANALQHTPPGTPVELRVEGQGDRVVLSVRDSGPGIPDAILPQIFERGIRSSSTGGYGLGLAITRRIVEAAGGNIQARNCMGRAGAEFLASFPAVQAVRKVEGA